MQKLVDDNALYAKLLASIKTEKTHFNRPLSPIETAALVDRLVNEEGKDVAETLIPIGKDMIGYFLMLKKELPEQCYDVVLWGESHDLGVGFTGAHFSLRLGNKDDILILYSACMQKKITKEEVKQIVSIYKKTKSSIEDAIEKVTNFRGVRKITTYMVVLAISEELIKKLEEKSNQLNKKSEEVFIESFREKFKIEKIEDFKIKGKNLAFSLSESDYKNYKKQVSGLDLIYDEITAYIVG